MKFSVIFDAEEGVCLSPYDSKFVSMRKIYCLLAAAVLFGMTGCSDKDTAFDQPETPGVTPEKPGDAEDPATDAAVEILTYVSVYADAKGDRPLIENYPVTSESTTLRFALPYGLNEVYVKYPTEEGVKTETFRVTEAPRTRASDPGTYDYFYRLEDKRYVELVYTKPETATPAYVTQNDGFTSYHSSGVVMFEDTWPSKSNVDGGKGEGLFFGDYNDLVVDYDLETNLKGDPKNGISTTKMWRDLKVVLHFRAKGGGYPRAFGLKLENLLKEFVWDEEPAMYWSMSNHGSCEWPLHAEVKWDGNLPVIYVSGLEQLTDPSFMGKNDLKVNDGRSVGSNSRFYNTINDGKRSNSNSGKGLLTLTVTFRGNLYAEHDKVVKHFRDAVMDTRQQNFFIETLQGGKTYEIHLPGYEPTGFYTTYEADKNDAAEGKAVAKDENTKYRAADGNVWAMKTPVLTRHATEQSSFAMAFPQYVQWLETGSEEYAAWYLNKNANMEVDENGVLKYIINPW